MKINSCKKLGDQRYTFGSLQIRQVFKVVNSYYIKIITSNQFDDEDECSPVNALNLHMGTLSYFDGTEIVTPCPEAELFTNER